MTKRLLTLLLPIVLLAATACETEQRAEGREQRDGGTARNARPTAPAEVFAYRTREGGRLLDVLVGRSQSDRVARVTRQSDDSSVRVRVGLDRGGELDLMYDCVTFRMDERLAGRAVVNGGTGRRIGQAKRGTEKAAWLRRACAHADRRGGEPVGR
ncbi:MAG: hypothetical protein MSC31_06545 [Solirubrobacteraceae bacterium MAG38_C4-C5]|nr:hypothetical protein [Candidatus Siliceabacter maunaloa]